MSLQSTNSNSKNLESHSVDQHIADLAIIAQLRGSQPFTTWMTALQQILNVPLALLAASHWPPCKNPAGCQNPLCAAMLNVRRECKSCENACTASPGAVETIKCLGNLQESALPIRLENRIIAFLCMGPYTLGPSRPSRRVHALSPALRKQVSKIPRFSVDALSAVLEVLKLLSSNLAQIASEHTLRHRLPPGIAAARRYVEQHYEQPITLATAAKHAGMSRGYFCRSFKKVLGIGFSEFLNQTRVNHAKTCLSDPTQRVTEICDRAGFKSLAHFNRTFKRLTGMNPTTYRQRALGIADPSSGKR